MEISRNSRKSSDFWEIKVPYFPKYNIYFLYPEYFQKKSAMLHIHSHSILLVMLLEFTTKHVVIC